MSSPENLPSFPQQPQPAGALALRPSGALQTQLLAQQQEADAQADDQIDLKAILRTLLKHKWTIVGTTALCTLAAVVYTLRVTPQYESTALLQIDRAAQKVVGFGADVEVEQAGSDLQQLTTQIELLKSRSLAERVIDEMGLYRPESQTDLPVEKNPAESDTPGADTSAEEPGFIGQLASNWRTLSTPSEEDEQVLSREQTIRQFQGAVSVGAIRNSRLVELKVVNSDPELAARIANTMAKAFITSNIERKVDSSVYARQFLEDQIKQTKAKLEESERQINDYAKKNQILNLGDKGSAATQTFVDFSAALGKAQQDRIKAESQYNEVKLNPDSAPQALENEAIQAYKGQKARLEAEYAKNLALYKPEFPTMVQARAQIGELDARIKAEVNTILALSLIHI